jgi:hypothetical protein
MEDGKISVYRIQEKHRKTVRHGDRKEDVTAKTHHAVSVPSKIFRRRRFTHRAPYGVYFPGMNLMEAVDFFRLYVHGIKQAFPRRAVEHSAPRVKPHIPGGTGGDGAGRSGDAADPAGQFPQGLSVMDKGETRRRGIAKKFQTERRKFYFQRLLLADANVRPPWRLFLPEA